MTNIIQVKSPLALTVIEDKELKTMINEDTNYKLKEYRKLVQARKRKELINPKDPEVYHHNIYKK